MKIYQLDYYLVDENELTEEELRSKMMSMFNNNKIIDAIATSHIVSSPVFIGFKFEPPIIIED